jgi:hypothetical protein
MPILRRACWWFSLVLIASAALAQAPLAWVGHFAEMEAHLRTAEVVRVEDIGTGVTHPQRAYLKPDTPFASLTWKVLPPGRRGGYWESYKSEIAAYELDKLLAMNMVPPAVERAVDGKTGAAIMWIDGTKSVKQEGGQVPSGPQFAKPIRMMQLFDNLIGNSDRNAGNILIDAENRMILIDHSRAFIEDHKLPWKFERVDATLWTKVKALTREQLSGSIGSWLEPHMIDAMLARRDEVAKQVDDLVKRRGAAAVIIP